MVPGENVVKFFPKGILSPTMALSCLILVSITSLASGSRLNDVYRELEEESGLNADYPSYQFPFQNYQEQPRQYQPRRNPSGPRQTKHAFVRPNVFSQDEDLDNMVLGLTEPQLGVQDFPAPEPVQAVRSGKFPKLSFKMKQFGVHPETEEYYAKDPDFLGFRLQEREAAQSQVENVDHSVFEGVPEIEIDTEDPQSEEKRARMGVASRLRWDGYTEETKDDDFFYTAFVAGSTAFVVLGVAGAGYCYQRTMKRRKDSEELEYPSYGITGPAKDASPGGDRKLAQSAQMYHYQHQKSQMIGAGEKGVGGGVGGEHSEVEESDGEEGEGDYTVYECPGLASTDEMEVKNPLFDYDPTPKP